MNKKELEKLLKEQQDALANTKKELAALGASDVLKRITNSVSGDLDVCTRIAGLTKEEQKVYIRKVAALYKKAFKECEPEFAELKRRNAERAERRKERQAKQAEQAVPKPVQEVRQPVVNQQVQNPQNSAQAGGGLFHR